MKNHHRLLSLILLTAILGCGGTNRVADVSASSSGVNVEGEPLTFSQQDWPSWRGPQGDGTISDRPLPTQWSAETNVIWTADVPGRGHSSPTVFGDTVYMATALDDEQKQLVLAYDLASGTSKWSTVVRQGGFPPVGQMHPKSTHANGTVACDGERVYCAFLGDEAVTAAALDLQGNVVWKQEVGKFSSKFGYAPSVQLYRSALIVSADHRGGGYLAALDRATGKIAWRKGRPARSSYSSARVVNSAGRDQLVICGCNQVASYDPLTGTELWSTSAATAEGTCGTIVANETHVFASGGYPQQQTVCIAADGSASVAWSNRTKLYEPSLLLDGDYLYGVSDNGVAYCWSVEDGIEQWKSRLDGSFSASPILCNGLIYVPNTNGTTFVFRASPDGYQEVQRNQLGNEAYSSLSVAGERIIARVVHTSGGRQEKLYCLGTTGEE